MTRAQKQQQLRDAMNDLVLDPRFGVFMRFIREELRENAVAYMTEHTTIKDQRESLAAVGEVRCYDFIWSIYREKLEEIQAKAEGQ